MAQDQLPVLSSTVILDIHDTDCCESETGFDRTISSSSVAMFHQITVSSAISDDIEIIPWECPQSAVHRLTIAVAQMIHRSS